MKRLVTAGVLLLGPAMHAGAQDEVSAAETDKGFVRVDVRVNSTQPSGGLLIDHGKSDGIARGDRVIFFPLGSRTYEGRVARAMDRTAVVELDDPAAGIAPGTRGEVRVPRSRFGTAEPVDPATETDPVVEHPPWEFEDEEWEPGMPLLAKVSAVKPADRESKLIARAYFRSDFIRASQDSRSDSFLRAGADLEYTNPFGYGGSAHLDGEWNYRSTDVPDDGDESDGTVRLDRFSYGRGGNRFEPNGWRVGRFLQRGVPEFGVVDGFEWVRRRENGHYFGGSIGWLPELDKDFESGHDFQLAGFYTWVADESERFTATAGFQKTAHNTDSDRDLLLGKVRYLDDTGWDYAATVWVDYYSSSDNVKSGVELTQAIASARKTWDERGGVEYAYTRFRFPDIDKFEFLPLPDDELEDNRYDRVSARGWIPWGEDREVHGEIGLWDDEDDSGGDLELGVEQANLWLDDSVADLTGFATQGLYTTTLGGRFTYGRYVGAGRWDVSYELADHDQDGFDGSIVQHRLRGSHSFVVGDGWRVRLELSGLLYDEEEENAWTAGVDVHKSF